MTEAEAGGQVDHVDGGGRTGGGDAGGPLPVRRGQMDFVLDEMTQRVANGPGTADELLDALLTAETSEAAGVRRIVLNSALGAGDYQKSFPSWHRRVEDKLKAAKIAHCILRPNSFMQNIAAYNAPSGAYGCCASHNFGSKRRK